MFMNVLQVKRLTKSFNRKIAIENLTFNITPGSITGFLGPNGAGKSTTMNIMMGFIRPSEGSVRIFGKSVIIDTPATRTQVGFLSNSTKLDKNLTVAQEIEYYGSLGGKYDNDYVDTLSKKLKLDMSLKIGNLSTGNYQKVALVIALMHKPKLLILDEPTTGLDPLIQTQFNKIILDLKKSGSTIFISSHILSEVQELCDEFIFIKEGKIVAQLKRADLKDISGKIITIKTNDKNHKKIMKYLKDNKIKHSVGGGSLEDVFMGYYGGENA